jgi:hypothetical protein
MSEKSPIIKHFSSSDQVGLWAAIQLVSHNLTHILSKTVGNLDRNMAETGINIYLELEDSVELNYT